jgi:hypothetical protein
MALSVAHHAAYGRGGDDRGAESLQRAVRLDGGVEEGQKGYSGEVDGRDVSVVGFVPFFYAVVVPQLLLQLACVDIVRFCLWAADAGIADEETGVLFFLLELFDYAVKVVFFA